MSNDDKIITLLNNIIKLCKETDRSAYRLNITKDGRFKIYFSIIDLYIESKSFVKILEKTEWYLLNNRFYIPNNKKYYKSIKKYKLIKHNKLCRKIKV